MAGIGVAPPVAIDPGGNPSPIQNRGIVTHGFSIGEHSRKRLRILGHEFAQQQPLSFENQHL
jgi:hypothetical protein